MSNINPNPFTTRPEIEGTFGVVTSTHWIATAVGMATLEKGGNAFDAGVATAFTLQVVEPHLNGPGGDVPIIVHDTRRGRTEVICGQGPAPAGATIAHYRAEGLDMVPGTGLLAGLYEFPNALGTLSREEAVSFARKIGFQPLRTEPLPDSKHVFTHVEWHMSGWLMEGYAETGPAGEELTFAGSEELKDVYALPSAFSAYRRILSGLFREEKEPCRKRR